jgi:hypothetical protein
MCREEATASQSHPVVVRNRLITGGKVESGSPGLGNGRHGGVAGAGAIGGGLLELSERAATSCRNSARTVDRPALRVVCSVD